MKKFLSFQEFATPRLAPKFFFVSAFFLSVICVASFIVTMRAGSFDGMLSSVMVLVLGLIILRMTFDVVLVLFRIYDLLRDLRDLTALRQKNQ